MRMLRTSLERNANAIEHYGNEVAESRLKKIAKIRRAVEILNHHIEDDFMELAEIQLGKKSVSTWDIEELEDGKGGKLIPLETEEQEAINMEIFKLSRELENSTWKELFSILQGQDYLEYAKNRPADEKFTEDQWYMWFDGSGMKGWWD
jgi:hypothetical protein